MSILRPLLAGLCPAPSSLPETAENLLSLHNEFHQTYFLMTQDIFCKFNTALIYPGEYLKNVHLITRFLTEFLYCNWETLSS